MSSTFCKTYYLSIFKEIVGIASAVKITGLTIDVFKYSLEVNNSFINSQFGKSTVDILSKTSKFYFGNLTSDILFNRVCCDPQNNYS